VKRTSRSLALQVAEYATMMGLVSLRGLIVLPLFSRMLGADAYGEFTQLIAIGTLLLPVLLLGLDSAAVRFLAGEADGSVVRDRFFGGLVLIALSGLVVCGLTTVAARPLAYSIFGDESRAPLSLLLGPYHVTQVVATYLLQYYRVISRVDILSRLRVIQVGVTTTVLWFTITRGGDVESGVVAMILSDSAFCALFGVLILLRNPGRPRPHLRALTPWLAFSLPLVPGNLMFWSLNYSDRLFVLHLFGTASVATYSIAYQFAAIVMFLTTPLSMVAFPLLTKLYQSDDRAGVTRTLSLLNRWFVILALPIAVGVSLVAGPIVRLLAKNISGVEPVLVLTLGASYVLHGIYQLNLFGLLLEHRTKTVTLLVAICMPINLALNALLIPRFGLRGAAAATAFAFLILGSFAGIWTARRFAVRFDLWSLTRSALATAGMGFAVHAFAATDWPSLGLSVAVGVVVYFAAVFALRVLTRDDWKAVRSVLQPGTRLAPPRDS
jgi:O-antigen/teichoic acid export membrane protein